MAAAVLDKPAAAAAPATLAPITCRVHARVGLLGNPSDGFYGKTLSLSLANFYAEVSALIPGCRAVVGFHAVPEFQAGHRSQGGHVSVLTRMRARTPMPGALLPSRRWRSPPLHCAARASPFLLTR